MSCSSYCQGLQSCLEPARHVEPRVLRLKLAPAKAENSGSSSSATPTGDKTDDNVYNGGWTFLQSLGSDNNNSKKDEETNHKDLKEYIPPNFKRSSSSKLTEKSLEMCTEGLGSETGSDGGESSDEMALLSLDNENMSSNETRLNRLNRKSSRRMTRAATFPPPLTSISGSSNVQVRTHRESGRLVMEAVSVSPSQTYFHAERVDGRLRLHLMKDRSSGEEKHEEEREIIAETAEENVEEVEEEEELSDESVVEEEYEGVEENWEAAEMEMEEDGGDEMGPEKVARRSCSVRCMESESSGNKSLRNWEPFWVST